MDGPNAGSRYVITLTDRATGAQYSTNFDELVVNIGEALLEMDTSTPRLWWAQWPAPIPPAPLGEWEGWWAQTRQMVRSWLGLPDDGDAEAWMAAD